jgi:hypothetical protein
MRLSLRRKTLILVAIVAVWLLFVPVISYAGESQTSQERMERLVALRARGIAIEKMEEERTRLPAGMGLLIRLGPRNETRIFLRVLKGRVRIGGSLYNVTDGRGVIFLARHAALLRFTALDKDGESVGFRFALRYWRTTRGLFAVRMRGFLQTKEGRVFLLLRGHAKLL